MSTNSQKNIPCFISEEEMISKDLKTATISDIDRFIDQLRQNISQETQIPVIENVNEKSMEQLFLHLKRNIPKLFVIKGKEIKCSLNVFDIFESFFPEKRKSIVFEVL